MRNLQREHIRMCFYSYLTDLLNEMQHPSIPRDIVSIRNPESVVRMQQIFEYVGALNWCAQRTRLNPTDKTHLEKVNRYFISGQG